ncbi:MAG TPA: TolC family protein, partial [Candidatus Acidoferrales bacterium]|nr:TolC family protein [Candidatus Acidoferrales bacterium]
MKSRALVVGIALFCQTAMPAAATQPPPLTLSLAQALALSERNNLDYQVAVQDVQVAQARVVQAGSALLPKIDLNYAYEHTQSAQTLAFALPNGAGGTVVQTIPLSATDTNAASAILQYVLYDGGADDARVGVAAAGYSAAQSELSAVRDTVQRDVTSAYFQLVEAQQAATIADQSVAVATQDVTTAEQLFAAGTAAKADVLRQRLSLAQAQSRQIAAHNDVALANASLANLLNVDLSSTIDPTEPLEAAPVEVNLQEALRTAQTDRPELRAAASATEIAKRTVALAEAGNFPVIAIDVEESSVKPSLFGVPQPQLSATLSATWHLFDGGLTR